MQPRRDQYGKIYCPANHRWDAFKKQCVRMTPEQLASAQAVQQERNAEQVQKRAAEQPLNDLYAKYRDEYGMATVGKPFNSIQAYTPEWYQVKNMALSRARKELAPTLYAAGHAGWWDNGVYTPPSLEEKERRNPGFLQKQAQYKSFGEYQNANPNEYLNGQYLGAGALNTFAQNNAPAPTPPPAPIIEEESEPTNTGGQFLSQELSQECPNGQVWSKEKGMCVSIGSNNYTGSGGLSATLFNFQNKKGVW